MSNVYGFKNDKCKVPIGTMVHHYNNVEQMKSDTKLKAGVKLYSVKLI